MSQNLNSLKKPGYIGFRVQSPNCLTGTIWGGVIEVSREIFGFRV